MSLLERATRLAERFESRAWHHRQARRADLELGRVERAAAVDDLRATLATVGPTAASAIAELVVRDVTDLRPTDVGLLVRVRHPVTGAIFTGRLVELGKFHRAAVLALLGNGTRVALTVPQE